MDASMYPAIASITAAFIAGGIAYLSSVLSKEQKTSEFRYAWLNAVLDDIAKFTGAAKSISAAGWSRSRSEGKEKAQAFLAGAEPQIRESLAAYYRARIRLYPDTHKKVLEALDRLEALLLKGELVDPATVDPLVRNVVRESHDALRQEWGKVKRGETTFVLTKYVSLAIFLLAVVGAGIAVYKASVTRLGAVNAPPVTVPPTRKQAPVTTDPLPPKSKPRKRDSG